MHYPVKGYKKYDSAGKEFDPVTAVTAILDMFFPNCGLTAPLIFDAIQVRFIGNRYQSAEPNHIQLGFSYSKRSVV
jgi:hypothetical protein